MPQQSMKGAIVPAPRENAYPSPATGRSRPTDLPPEVRQ